MCWPWASKHRWSQFQKQQSSACSSTNRRSTARSTSNVALSRVCQISRSGFTPWRYEWSYKGWQVWRIGKKSCNMHVGHLNLKRQLWQRTTAVTEPAKKRQLWQNMKGPPADTQALSTSGENMKGPPAGNKTLKGPPGGTETLSTSNFIYLVYSSTINRKCTGN